MSELIVKSTLKKLVSECLVSKKISSDESVSLLSFINALTDKNYIEIGYADFDKLLSSGLAFKDSDRVASFSTDKNPSQVGNVTEELAFDADEITTTYSNLESISIFNTDGTTEYDLNTDYTVDLTTGVISRVLLGAIADDEVVNLVYFSKEAKTVSTAVLQTKKITMQECVLKAIIVDADSKDVSYELAKNSLDFYSINSYNISEQVAVGDELYLRVVTTSPNSIRKIMLIFDKNLN